MTKTQNKIGIILAGLAMLATLFFALEAGAAAGAKIRNQDTGYSQPYTFFTATTSPATSTAAATVNDPGFFNIAGAKKVVLYFTHGGAATSSTGTSTFSVQVTPDGTNWYDYNKLVSGTSSAPVARIPIEGATTTVYANLSTILTDAFYGVRCIVTETGAGGPGVQGEHSCSAYAEF